MATLEIVNKNIWESMREVLMPTPVGFVFVGVEKTKKKSSQATIEGLDCFSSSLRSATAREAVTP